MENETNCPKCNSENAYPDGTVWICPECFHEWDPKLEAPAPSTEESNSDVIVDSNGTVLKDGDTVTVIKDLKVKGSPTGLKSGTKVKNIRLVESTDGHNISCKIEGFGAMYLKSEIVKKL